MGLDIAVRALFRDEWMRDSSALWRARREARRLSDVLISGSGGGGVCWAERHLLALKTDRDKEMPQAVERLAIEEIRSEINRERSGIFAELPQQGGFVETRHQNDQILNLLRLHHGPILPMIRFALTTRGTNQLMFLSSPYRVRGRPSLLRLAPGQVPAMAAFSREAAGRP
jgi:hypothetical protein